MGWVLRSYVQLAPSSPGRNQHEGHAKPHSDWVALGNTKNLPLGELVGSIHRGRSVVGTFERHLFNSEFDFRCEYLAYMRQVACTKQAKSAAPVERHDQRTVRLRRLTAGRNAHIGTIEIKIKQTYSLE
jgi:hypothetical protein